ncbi:hypothetical protein ACLOJK_038655 [Asimina triloba]
MRNLRAVKGAPRDIRMENEVASMAFISRGLVLEVVKSSSGDCWQRLRFGKLLQYCCKRENPSPHGQICDFDVFPIAGQAAPCCLRKSITASSSSMSADHETLPPEMSSLSHFRKSNPRMSSPAPIPVPATSFLDKDPQYITVLVAGSTGHIGRFIVKELIRCGFHIVSVARERSGVCDQKTKEDTLRDLHSSRICFSNLTDVVALDASPTKFCGGWMIDVGARELGRDRRLGGRYCARRRERERDRDPGCDFF